ncbi:hypothetical protein ACX9R5_07450 [Rathayibacter sp. CAU 1779]
MTTTSSLQRLTAAAIDALTGERWGIMDAAPHVSPRPGLYAIHETSSE